MLLIAAPGQSVHLPTFPEIPDDGGMRLSRKAIEELKAIHKQHADEELSDDEAWEMGNRPPRRFDIRVYPLCRRRRGSNPTVA